KCALTVSPLPPLRYRPTRENRHDRYEKCAPPMMVTPHPLALATASRFSPRRRETAARILKACIRPPHRAAHSNPEVSPELRGPLHVPPTIAPPAILDH